MEFVPSGGSNPMLR